MNFFEQSKIAVLRKLIDRKPNIEFVRKSYRHLNQAIALRGELTNVELATAYIMMQEIHNNNMLKIGYNNQMQELLNCRFVSCDKDKPANIAKLFSSSNIVMISKQFYQHTLPQMTQSGLF